MHPNVQLDNQRIENATFADEVIRVFDQLKDILGDHYRWADARFVGAHNEHGIEAAKRLTQMLWMLNKIRALQDEGSRAMAACVPPLNLGFQSDEMKDWTARKDAGEFAAIQRRLVEISPEMEMLAEAFYYFGARCRSVIRQLPGLQNFESVGLRDVRNHLIEHPEGKSSRLIANGFGWGKAHGPVLKAIRNVGQEHIFPDKGLFANASEFAANLNEAIKRAITPE